MPTVHVIVYYRAEGPPEALDAAYRATRDGLAGTPGLEGHELLHSADRDGRFALLMKWRDLDAFHTWERRLRAAGHPSPLRSYQDRTRAGGHYEVYEVRRTRAVTSR